MLRSYVNRLGASRSFNPALGGALVVVHVLLNQILLT